MDEARTRYLHDRVMTATPAQRVVMLFDRLALDLQRACEIEDDVEAGRHIGHATTVVGELYSSLDLTAGGPAENLAQLYGFLLGELTAIRSTGERERLAGPVEIVAGLRDAFASAAATLASAASVAASASTASLAFGNAARAASSSAWVG